jgi:hypothetical protein
VACRHVGLLRLARRLRGLRSAADRQRHKQAG